jgi:ATP-binding cassette, subfamily B, bacterial
MNEFLKRKKFDNSTPIGFMFKKLWTFSSGNHKRVVLYMIMSSLAEGFYSLMPLVFAHVLNIVQLEGVSSDNLVKILLWIFFIFILELITWALHGPARVMEMSNAYRTSARYKNYLVSGVMSLPASWHTNQHSGDIIDKVNRASQGLKMFSERTFVVINVLISFLISLGVIFYFNFSSGIIVMFFVFFAIYTILRMDKILVKRFDKQNKMQNHISAKIYDFISNISTVIILRIERLASRNIAKSLFKPYKYEVKTNKYNELKWFFVSLFVYSMIVVVLFIFIISHVKSGEVILIGSLSALYAYSSRIGGIFYNFAFRYGEIVKWRTDVANVEGISDLFTRQAKKRKINLGNQWSSILVKNLQFQYEDEKNILHLDNISFEILRGQRIAFIGYSGSGKTTALKIIRELYPSKHVELFIDQSPISGCFSNISHEIALIPQDPEIFSSTIKENITLGLSCSKEELSRVIALAKFDSVVKKLPKGLESTTVEKGVNLSGGEKQRLALARGLFACKDKEIILLDEPTSSVDQKNEYEIYINIFNEFSHKTLISSIHRLQLLPLFDMIYVFDKGKIVTKGSYNELKNDPIYKKIFLKKKETLKITNTSKVNKNTNIIKKAKINNPAKKTKTNKNFKQKNPKTSSRK